MEEIPASSNCNSTCQAKSTRKLFQLLNAVFKSTDGEDCFFAALDSLNKLPIFLHPRPHSSKCFWRSTRLLLLCFVSPSCPVLAEKKNGFPNGLKREGKEKIWFRSQSCCFDKLGKIILSGLMYGCMQIPNYCFGQCLLFGSPGLERCRLYPWNEPLSQMQKLCTKCDGVVNCTVAHAVI